MFALFFKKYAIKNAITKLIKKNPNQLTFREYSYLANIIIEKKSCNVLVFGVGLDSKLWIQANKKGKTFFLENSVSWLGQIRTLNLDMCAFLIKYNTIRKDWETLLGDNSNRLMLSLPKPVTDIEWDIIFVDGPAGYDDSSPGRMQSIYTSSVLAKNSKIADIFVHDCDRSVEKAYCDHFFADLEFVGEFDRLRHYKKRNLIYY